jgi:hypothetical protein
MTLIAQEVPDGARIVDVDEELTPERVDAICNHRDPDGGRITGVCLYVNFSGGGGNFLTKRSVASCKGKLGIIPVQHVRFGRTETNPGYHPNGIMGNADGVAMVTALRAVDMPNGLTPSYDMEGPSADTTLADCSAYDAEWFDQVHRALHIPSGYFGYGLPFTNGHELYEFKVPRYWKSGSMVVEPDCGWAMIQDPRFDVNVGGVIVDRDHAMADKKGRRMVWAIDDGLEVAV